MEPLFLDKEPLVFEKIGFEHKLSEDMNLWPSEILDELYRQAPFCSDFAPKVDLREQDPDRRYAMGHVELRNKLAGSTRDDMTPPGLKGQQKVVVPIIVKDGRVQPMDIFLSNGQVEPLTDDRVRTALFRPNLFEAVKKRPGDLSLVEQLYPPHRGGGGGGGTPMMGMKTAAPKMLFDAILPTVKQADIQRVEDQLNADPSLRTALMKNAACRGFLEKMAAVQGSHIPRGAFLKEAMANVRPTVIQLQKTAMGFKLKTAAPNALIPDADDINRPQAVGMLGEDVVSRTETDGTTTVSAAPVVKNSLTDFHAKVADAFGLYKVRTKDGRELVGWVFPHSVDLDGTVLGVSVFSNGSEGAMQENIAGELVGKSGNVINKKPEGAGVFYYVSKTGATAIVPVEVESELSENGQEGYLCKTVMGEPCQLIKTPGLRSISQMEDSVYGIPEDCGFMPAPKMVDLSSSPDELSKVAQARELPYTVEVITDGSTYGFRGGVAEKVAQVMPVQWLDKDDAVFVGAIMGQDPGTFSNQLDHMRDDGYYTMKIAAGPVTLMRDKVKESASTARTKLASISLSPAYLLKEAAAMEDPTAVDKVLSIGFLNPENMQIFGTYAADFEDSIKKLCEVLLAARLGMSAVDEGALQKSVVHLDKVVAGLKAMSMGS